MYMRRRSLYLDGANVPVSNRSLLVDLNSIHEYCGIFIEFAKMGVPKGSILASLFFGILINDVLHNTQNEFQILQQRGWWYCWSFIQSVVWIKLSD